MFENRSLQKIVAVSAVIVQDGDVLLIQRGHEPALGMWSLPGGSCESGETLEQALIREVKEETNLDVTVVTETFHQDIQLSPEHIYDLHTFTVSVISGSAVAGGQGVRDGKSDLGLSSQGGKKSTSTIGSRPWA